MSQPSANEMDPIEGPTTAEDRQGLPMPSRRYVRRSAVLCAGSRLRRSGPLLSKGTGVGTLKTSLSHMEYENQQLRREVASLKAEIRQTEDRLVQEEAANGEISARLDNATAMLRRRGLEGSELADTGPADPGPERPRTTLPAGRSNKKARKPPSAQIPGRLEVLPPSESDDTTSNGWGSWSPDTDADPAAQCRRDAPVVWLPVARDASDSSATRR